MNCPTHGELRDALLPWTNRLPPAEDDPYYERRFIALCLGGHHPAVAAVLADDANFGLNHRYRRAGCGQPVDEPRSRDPLVTVVA